MHDRDTIAAIATPAGRGGIGIVRLSGPRAKEIADIGGYRTYVNALVVGGTVFMPTYGVAADADARATYERLGFRVVPIRSNVLSDQFNGSVHCQTMAYPDMDLRKLLGGLNLREI